MNYKDTFQIFLASAAMLFLHTELPACTGIQLTAKDGTSVNGRTLEFGVPVEITTAVVPRGYEFVGTTPQGSGLKYKAKYGAVGGFAFGTSALLDGLNEKGLSVATFYFPGYAQYASVTPENQARALSPVEFPNWLLTQFATVAEVKSGLDQIVIAPTVTKAWGDTPPPFHYIVYDKQGTVLVIEPIKGKLVTDDNPLGVLTNSPDFDWQITNLRNYINLTPFNVKPITFKGVALAPFGQGSGMVGLPGDFTPPSRFVRAAIFSATATPSENAEAAVYQAFHILNQFDIPVGFIRQKEDGEVHSDVTQMTSVKDPQSLKYYFKTYSNQNIKVVDLKQFDLNAMTFKQADENTTAQAIDVSSLLK